MPQKWQCYGGKKESPSSTFQILIDTPKKQAYTIREFPAWVKLDSDKLCQVKEK